MNNNFNIHSYFSHNYGLGDKPAITKIKWLTKWRALCTLAALVLLFVAGPVGIAAAVVVALIFYVPPILKNNKEKKAAEEWQNNYNIRKNTWDEEYDKFYANRVAKLNPKKSAILKLGLNLNPDIIDEKKRTAAEKEEYPTEPFDVYGNLYDGWYRRGKDGIYRTDSNEITWLFFSKEQIYIYTIKFKLTEENKKRENTQEFFYDDIVSVSIATSSTELKQSNGFGTNEDSIETEEFRLVVPGDKMIFAFTSNDKTNNSVQGMKNAIREKKNPKK